MCDDEDNEGEKRVLLTGAFGNVGEWLIQELRALNCVLSCFDLETQANTRKATRLAKIHRFECVWGDITDASQLAVQVARIRPDIIVHAAAIIPPLSIKRPELAREVNVDGTRALLTAAHAAGGVERFILVSSYSVCGPCNPHRDDTPWTGDTPVNPQDDYGLQKVEAERIVQAGLLPWAIIRLCAVYPLAESGIDPDTLRFSFELPYDRREQAIDVRDAALAIAKAAVANEAVGRILTVGGGEGWHGLGGEMTNAMVQAAGLRPFPREAYRLADPAVDASWFYENWVDTSESQRILGYQRYSFSDFLQERRRRMGPVRYVLPLLGGLIVRSLLRNSPYHGVPQRPDSRPFAEAARAALKKAAGK